MRIVGAEGIMPLGERTLSDVVVLDLDGELQLGQSADRLRDRVTVLLQGGHRKILTNLEGVTAVDSAGLGELVRSYVTTTPQGGSFKLLHVSRHLRELLDATGLLKVFETFDSEPEALASFRAPAN